MITHLDGETIARCDGCYRIVEDDASTRYITHDGREGHICDTLFAACSEKFIAAEPSYRCPDCVHTGEDPCPHQERRNRTSWAADGQRGNYELGAGAGA